MGVHAAQEKAADGVEKNKVKAEKVEKMHAKTIESLHKKGENTVRLSIKTDKGIDTGLRICCFKLSLKNNTVRGKYGVFSRV